MGEFSLSHILLLLVIVLLFFGPSRLPQLGKALGQSLRGFKEGMNDFNREFENSSKTQNAPTPQQLSASQPTQGAAPVVSPSVSTPTTAASDAPLASAPAAASRTQTKSENHDN